MVQFSKGVGFGMTRNLNQTSNTIQKALAQLSSGKKITSDDTSGGVTAGRLESVYRGINEQIQGAQQDLSMAQVEEGGLSSISTDLQRVRELQVQAQSSGDTETIVAIQDEIDELAQNIQETIQNTAFGEQKLLEAGEALEAFLDGGIDATEDLAATDEALDEVSAQRAEVGARMNASQSRIDQLGIAFENVLASQSQIADTDIAETATQLANEQIVQQLSVGAIRNLMAINRQSVLGVLGTLGG